MISEDEVCWLKNIISFISNYKMFSSATDCSIIEEEYRGISKIKSVPLLRFTIIVVVLCFILLCFGIWLLQLGLGCGLDDWVLIFYGGKNFSNYYAYTNSVAHHTHVQWVVGTISPRIKWLFIYLFIKFISIHPI
jgi:hypothetical protein